MKLILTADWHLRDDTPRCRTDDFQKAQWEKVDKIYQMASGIDDGLTILNAGDIFDIGRSAQETEALLFQHLGEGVHMIATVGNHDLPYHSMKQLKNSSINVMFASGVLIPALSPDEPVRWFGDKIHIYGFPWGMSLEFDPRKLDRNHLNIALVHAYVYNKAAYAKEGQIAVHANTIFQELRGFDLIVTGHNHQPFTVQSPDGRLLVNPGSLTRQAANETHQPRVYIYDTDIRSVQTHMFDIDPKAVTDVHLVAAHAREDRLVSLIDAFQKNSTADTGDALDVFADMEWFILENRETIDEDTEEMIWMSLRPKPQNI